MNRRQGSIFAGLALALVTVQVPAQAAIPGGYPVISRLAPSDLVFSQLQAAISQAYRAESAAADWPDLFLCAWVSTGDEDLFSLAARMSLPYETIAGLNRLTRPAAIPAGRVVLIPSMPGLFVPETPAGDMDLMLGARLGSEGRVPTRLTVRTAAGGTRFLFYPGTRLYATERSFFLNVGFRAPLAAGVLTSGYGMRSSPIDGHDRLHSGVDLAAPAGSDVYAARAGTVVAVGNDPALGLRIVISHEGGWKTVYGHLSKAWVELNQLVLSGTIIGAVGSSGLSTGPHLHFEIQSGGTPRDPSSYLPGMAP